MLAIDLAGGMSWESAVPSDRTVTEVVRERLGGLHPAKAAVVSVDSADVVRRSHAGAWADAGNLAAAPTVRRRLKPVDRPAQRRPAIGQAPTARSGLWASTVGLFAEREAAPASPAEAPTGS